MTVPVPSAGIVDLAWAVDLTTQVNTLLALTADYASRPKGIIARGRRVTTSTTTTGTVGVMRIDDVSITAGRLYFVKATAHLDSSAADIMAAKVFYTTDGSTPTTSSATLPGSATDGAQANAAFGESRLVLTDYTPSGSETLSLLLAVTRLTGSGNASIHADGTGYNTSLYLIDMGIDPGSTSVNI